jgi:hypothetical protein
VLCSELIFRRWQLREARRHLNGTAETVDSFLRLSSNAYDNLPHLPVNSLLNVHGQWPPALFHHSPPLFGHLLRWPALIHVPLPSLPFSGLTITLLPLCPHAQLNQVRDIKTPQMRSVGSHQKRASRRCPHPQHWIAPPLFRRNLSPCNYTPKSVL